MVDLRVRSLLGLKARIVNLGCLLACTMCTILRVSTSQPDLSLHEHRTFAVEQGLLGSPCLKRAELVVLACRMDARGGVDDPKAPSALYTLQAKCYTATATPTLCGRARRRGRPKRECGGEGRGAARTKPHGDQQCRNALRHYCRRNRFIWIVFLRNNTGSACC